MKVLVTGATGFVGTALCRVLQARGHQVVAALRRPTPLAGGIEGRVVGELGSDTDWRPALAGIDAVIHLAARAHVMKEAAADALALYRAVNRDGAARLAEQTALAGVRRLVFVSSIKVNGEATPPDQPFRADDVLAPCDPYGVSKAEAEQQLTAIAARTGLELVIVRPPLVHGPGAKGNLAAALRLLDRHWPLPLPLGAIRNRRSLVGLDNLTDGLAFVLTHRQAAGNVFLIRDGEDVSTPQLFRMLAAALGRQPCLLPIPPAVLALAGRLLGKRAAIARLTGSLVVDDAPLRALGWRPPLGLTEGLAAMAAATRSRSVTR